MADCNRALGLDPNLADAHRARGAVYLEQGDLEQAILDFDKAIELDPELAGAYFGRGYGHVLSGNPEQAIQDFDKAVELDPDLNPAYLWRGLASADSGKPEQAISDLDYFLELVPDAPIREDIINVIESLKLAQEPVTFRSNAWAELTGVTISFQHPRAWQTSYFSDSGASGWLVSDADPNDAFWAALSTGEEIVILVMPISDPDALSELLDLSQEPGSIEGMVEFEFGDKQAFYSIANEELRGAVVNDQTAFFLFGYFPAEKESDFREGIGAILTTLDWTEIEDIVSPKDRLLGTRQEGQLELGYTLDGYVPLASISEWAFEGSADQEIYVAINTHDPQVTLIVDVLDESGKSLLPPGLNKFIGSVEIEKLKLPTDGTYTIELAAPTGFAKYFPENPASETKVYGWYQISVEPGKAEISSKVNPDWLITAEALNSFSEDIGVAQWAVEEYWPGQSRVCRDFIGVSGSAKPGRAMNCVNENISGSTFADIVDSLYDQQFLYPTDIALEPSFDYNGRFALYAQGGAGPPFYDAYLVGDGMLFRATVSVGAPDGYTSETLFEEQGEAIEAFLNKILLISLERTGQTAILDDAGAFYAQGQAVYDIGDYERAVVGFTRAIELAPEGIEVYHSRGLAYHHLADYDQAIADFDKHLALNPDDAAATYNRGHAYHQSGEYEQAIADFTSAIELEYDSLSWAYNDRGLVFQKLGDGEQALADFNTALELDPDYVGAYYNRGNFYARQGDDEQAIADYSQAIALNPSLVRAYLSRGAAYSRLGNNDQAVADYTEATTLDPLNAAAHNNLAWYLAVDLDTDYETALEHVQQAVELDPNSGTHDTLAMVYYKLEQYDNALEQYDLALSFGDGNFYSFKGRGDVYLAMGNQAAALADYEAFLAQAPAGPERDEVEEIVESLQTR